MADMAKTNPKKEPRAGARKHGRDEVSRESGANKAPALAARTPGTRKRGG